MSLSMGYLLNHGLIGLTLHHFIPNLKNSTGTPGPHARGECPSYTYGASAYICCGLPQFFTGPMSAACVFVVISAHTKLCKCNAHRTAFKYMSVCSKPKQLYFAVL